MLKKNFGERVKGLLSSLDMTQQELAWLLGISYVSVSRWTTGEMKPSRLTDMVIGSLELVVKEGRGEDLVKAIRNKSIQGGTPDALRFISELAFARSGR
jgi:transcriptional regulator with XRE-family HTH domain